MKLNLEELTRLELFLDNNDSYVINANDVIEFDMPNGFVLSIDEGRTDEIHLVLANKEQNDSIDSFYNRLVEEKNLIQIGLFYKDNYHINLFIPTVDGYLKTIKEDIKNSYFIGPKDYFNIHLTKLSEEEFIEENKNSKYYQLLVNKKANSQEEYSEEAIDTINAIDDYEDNTEDDFEDFIASISDSLFDDIAF